MELPAIFIPSRRNGLIFHSGLALLLGGSGGVCLLLAVQQESGNLFTLFLVLSILLLVPLPYIFYRGYALFRARYILEREGLRLHWGLRNEDIPISIIQWIRPAAELGFHLSLPRLRLPGAILGIRHTDGLGEVEYLASGHENMLLVATPGKIYALNPGKPVDFMHAFQSISEMGSLTPITSLSERPASFLLQAWNDRWLRTLTLAGLLLTLTLLVLVNVYIPLLDQVSIGFNTDGTLLPPGPPEFLLLLPVLAGFTYIFDLIASLFFYRYPAQRMIAYILAGSSIITPVLLIVAVFLLI